jgi:hypothetical protein
MYKLLLVLALVYCLDGRAAAQCCGDCNGDGTVTITDLIIAVNNALGSCAEATPTPPPTVTPTPIPSCPSSFTDSGNALCGFRGPFNRGCGADLDSVFSINGSTLVVTIATGLTSPPTVAFSAHVDSATQASLSAWTSNNFQTIHPLAGTVQLAQNATQLIVFPNDPPFMILSCNFVQYDGAYTGRPRAAAAQTAGDAGPDDAHALERLRIWQDQPVENFIGP